MKTFGQQVKKMWKNIYALEQQKKEDEH